MNYIQRYLESTVLETNKSFKVLYVGGPRQVGKTTMLQKLAGQLGMNYVTLDDREAREFALRDPGLFFKQYTCPLLIDGVQYAPELFSEIKYIVDKSDTRGQFWLTGSEQFSAMKNVRESLAGRVGILTLLGFSTAELLHTAKLPAPFSPLAYGAVGDTSAQELFTNIIRGSFPARYQPEAGSTESFYNSYIQTYLERDIAQLFNVSKLADFQVFIQLCAARTGQTLNMSDLARDAGVSVPTASDWLNILESGRQIYLLRPYFVNISKRLVKAPKLYFLDTGLAAYLTKWRTGESLQFGAMAGAFFETFIVSEIIKSYLFRGIEPPLYYLRDQEGHEVDLLIDEGQRLLPIEIKLSATISSADVTPTVFWRKKIKNLGPGAVVCAVQKASTFDRETTLIPYALIS